MLGRMMPLSLALALPSLSLAGDGNTLKNPDFARTLEDDASVPAEWQLPHDNAGAWRRVNDDGPTGNFCLRYRCEDSRGCGPVSQVCGAAPSSD